MVPGLSGMVPDLPGIVPVLSDHISNRSVALRIDVGEVWFEVAEIDDEEPQLR